MNEKEKVDFGMDWFIKEASARATTKNQVEMRDLLIAYNQVRSILSEFETEGVQITTSGFVEQTKLSSGRQQTISSVADFIIRKENVELQLEIKLKADQIVLLPEDYDRYSRILSSSPNTQEILVTWNEENLPTLSLDLVHIQKQRRIEGQTAINIRELPNLKEAIRQAFNKYHPDWFQAVAVEFEKPERYDVDMLFSTALEAKITELTETASRRRYEDRRQALGSITNEDLSLLKKIFSDSRMKTLTTDDIERLLLDYYLNK